MGANLDMDRIAKAMGAERRGKVTARGGYFGAIELAAEVAARFRVPEGGGRATEPSYWSRAEERLRQHARQNAASGGGQAHHR